MYILLKNMIIRNKKASLKFRLGFSLIFGNTLLVLSANQLSVKANPNSSPSVTPNSNFQTSELLVKDLKNPSTSVEFLEANLSQTPQTDYSENCPPQAISLVPSSQLLLESPENPEIEIPIISTQTLLKCTKTQASQTEGIAQNVPTETDFQETAPEGVEPVIPPTNEQPSEQEPTSPIEKTPETSSEAAAGASLAQQSQNPLADLISLPFQHNLNFGTGPRERMQYIMNVQPVVPIKLSEDWSVVSRTIVPFINQPKALDDTTFGIGDINPQFFFVPTTDNEELTIGFGPTLVLPTASATVTGSGKWGFGPTAVVVWTRGRIVAGALASHTWSIAGDPNRRRIDFTLIQPFFNYNLPNGWFLVTSPFITADWANRDGDQWTLPIGGGVGRLFTVARQPINLSAQAYYNVVRPDEGSDWSLRISLTLLFPK